MDSLKGVHHPSVRQRPAVVAYFGRLADRQGRGEGRGERHAGIFFPFVDCLEGHPHARVATPCKGIARRARRGGPG
jgi:hypothetical protein